MAVIDPAKITNRGGVVLPDDVGVVEVEGVFVVSALKCLQQASDDLYILVRNKRSSCLHCRGLERNGLAEPLGYAVQRQPLGGPVVRRCSSTR